jgi:hypothetical protein
MIRISKMLIPLTQGMVAIVDAEDYECLAAHRWHAIRASNGQFYAVRAVKQTDGSWQRLYMHNAIMGDAPAPGMTVDHRETDATLDNRRSNLRWATKAQQGCNRRRRCNNTSGYKGVSLHRATKKWLAQIRHCGVTISLGLFATKEDAHSCYCAAAAKLHGEFSRTD